MGVIPHLSWLGPAAGFGGLGVPQQFLAEDPVGTVPRLSWLGPAIGCGGVRAPCKSWPRAL